MPLKLAQEYTLTQAPMAQALDPTETQNIQNTNPDELENQDDVLRQQEIKTLQDQLRLIQSKLDLMRSQALPAPVP